MVYHLVQAGDGPDLCISEAELFCPIMNQGTRCEVLSVTLPGNAQTSQLWGLAPTSIRVATTATAEPPLDEVEPI